MFITSKNTNLKPTSHTKLSQMIARDVSIQTASIYQEAPSGRQNRFCATSNFS